MSEQPDPGPPAEHDGTLSKGTPASAAHPRTEGDGDEDRDEDEDVLGDDDPEREEADRPAATFTPLRLAFTDQMRQQLFSPLQPTFDAIRAQVLATAAPVTTPIIAPLQQQMATIAQNTLAGARWHPLALPPGFFDGITDLWLRHLPPNWSRKDRVGPTVDVVIGDELPLVWVPRADLVTAVVKAADRAARIEILLAHQHEVLQDCDAVLDSIDQPTRPGDLQLTREAVQTLRAGHPAAAQALVAAVLEATVTAQVTKPSTVRTRVRFDEDSELVELRLRVAIAPLEPYFRSFEQDKTPEALRPLGPNRHLTVHTATPEHLCPANALVSVMLLVSVLRALQDLAALRAGGVDTSWLTGPDKP